MIIKKNEKNFQNDGKVLLLDLGRVSMGAQILQNSLHDLEFYSILTNTILKGKK